MSQDYGMWQEINKGKGRIPAIFQTAWAVITVIIMVWALVSGFLTGLFAYQLILIALSTVALMFAIAYFGLVWFDFASKFIGHKAEAERVSAELQNMLEVGHVYLKLDQIAQIWAGEKYGLIQEFNPKLRKLKLAAEAQAIALAPSEKLPAGKNTAVSVHDAIKLIKSGEIKEYKK